MGSDHRAAAPASRCWLASTTRGRVANLASFVATGLSAPLGVRVGPCCPRVANVTGLSRGVSSTLVELLVIVAGRLVGGLSAS
jgi:hypothetical protein